MAAAPVGLPCLWPALDRPGWGTARVLACERTGSWERPCELFAKGLGRGAGGRRESSRGAGTAPACSVLRTHLLRPRPGAVAGVTEDMSPAPTRLPIQWRMDV